MPPRSYSLPTMKPVMFCRKISGMRRRLHSSMKCVTLSADSENRTPLTQVAQLDEVRHLERRFGEQDAVVGDEAHQEPMEPREAGHHCRGISLLELVEARAVDDAGDDLADVVRLANVGVDDAIDVGGVVSRLLRRRH